MSPQSSLEALQNRWYRGPNPRFTWARFDLFIGPCSRHTLSVLNIWDGVKRGKWFATRIYLFLGCRGCPIGPVAVWDNSIRVV
jgi:hypothetical protein